MNHAIDPLPLLQLSADSLQNLANHHETGMGFWIGEVTDGSSYSILSDGAALPLQDDPTFYSILDLLAGTPLPSIRAFAN